MAQTSGGNMDEPRPRRAAVSELWDNSRIVEVFKHLSHGHCTHEDKEEQTESAEQMLWRNPEHKLEVEGVQFSY